MMRTVLPWLRANANRSSSCSLSSSGMSESLDCSQRLNHVDRHLATTVLMFTDIFDPDPANIEASCKTKFLCHHPNHRRPRRHTRHLRRNRHMPHGPARVIGLDAVSDVVVLRQGDAEFLGHTLDMPLQTARLLGLFHHLAGIERLGAGVLAQTLQRRSLL